MFSTKLNPETRRYLGQFTSKGNSNTRTSKRAEINQERKGKRKFGYK